MKTDNSKAEFGYFITQLNDNVGKELKGTKLVLDMLSKYGTPRSKVERWIELLNEEQYVEYCPIELGGIQIVGSNTFKVLKPYIR